MGQASTRSTKNKPNKANHKPGMNSIDKAIAKAANNAKKVDREVKKLLLLGAGESGKTTVYKQLSHAQKPELTEFERLRIRQTIFNNILEGTLGLLLAAQAIENEGIDDSALEQEKKTIWAEITKYQPEREGSFDENEVPGFFLPSVDYFMPPEVAAAIVTIWESGVYSDLYWKCLKHGQYNVPDTYRQLVQLLSGPYQKQGMEWLPTHEENVLSRQRTSGINEFTYNADEKGFFNVIDVGGQRTERKKWAQRLNDVDAVLFVSSLSEYDQTLWEDSTVPRIKESLQLFKKYAVFPRFDQSTFMLFLNKIDLFKEKFVDHKIPLPSVANFKEPPKFDPEAPTQSYQEGLKWYRDLYFSMFPPGHDSMYVHETCALDKGSMDQVVGVVVRAIAEHNMAIHNLPIDNVVLNL